MFTVDSSELKHAVDFLRQLIQIQSLPGQEEEIANVILSKMAELGYENVRRDDAGNVIGEVPGTGGPPMAFNTHLDHVDVGDPSVWPHPPYDGHTDGERVWGRGAVDIKGPLVSQLFGAAPQPGRPPAGTVAVTMVVQEEVGGLGARYLCDYLANQLRAKAVIVGEPSRNTLRRGHRGRAELVATLTGKSVHASVPHLGANPLPSLGRFLARLGELPMKNHAALGRSTLVPTLLSTDQTSANVIPSNVSQTLDWRWVPEEDLEAMRLAVSTLLQQCLGDGVTGHVDVPAVDRTSYTGFKMTRPADNPAYALEEGHPWLVAAYQLLGFVPLKPSFGEQEAPGDIWQFATDGGHFAKHDLAPIGFGPGDERLAHTIDEHVEIAQLERAIAVNRAFATGLASQVEQRS